MNLKPHRSREYLRLSPHQEKEEVASKSALLRQIKEVRKWSSMEKYIHLDLLLALYFVSAYIQIFCGSGGGDGCLFFLRKV